MSAYARPSIKEFLPRLVEYMRSATTRDEAYQRLADELGVSVEAVRNAASKAGLTTSNHTLRYTFSEREEEILVCACLIYARQGTPFTVPVFIDVARILAERDEDHPFSRHFVSDFVERHRDALCMDNGKITSPTRSSDKMVEMTKDFIAVFSQLVRTKKANEKNIFVFDETIIGVNHSLPIVIGETKASAGGNNNVIMTRESALGSYIPFSMVDGTTPFRVFISRTKEFHGTRDPEYAIMPAEEKGLRGAPHRLFLCSKTGYISNDLFKCIMDEFTSWWTSTRPGLECFLISDNLSIHRNPTVVMEAKRNGIHMLNIMPGSSHWFQVHDQLPFAVLKKELMVENNKCFGSFFLPRQVSRTLLMCNFYKAESCALKPEVLIKSFADVGLWPFDPERIMDNCRKFCSVQPEPSDSDDLNKLAIAIKECIEEQLHKAGQTLCSMKCVRVTSPAKCEKRNRRDQKQSTSAVSRNSASSTPTESNGNLHATKPARKRGRPSKASSSK